MRVDMREHKAIRDQVHAGLSALRVQGRQIWDGTSQTEKTPYYMALSEIVIRLMVGVGDVARLARDGKPDSHLKIIDYGGAAPPKNAAEEWTRELKKELGNIIFSTIRWIDDLGLDVLECLDLAIEAQERFAKSGRPR